MGGGWDVGKLRCLTDNQSHAVRENLIGLTLDPAAQVRPLRLDGQAVEVWMQKMLLPKLFRSIPDLHRLDIDILGVVRMA